MKKYKRFGLSNPYFCPRTLWVLLIDRMLKRQNMFLSLHQLFLLLIDAWLKTETTLTRWFHYQSRWRLIIMQNRDYILDQYWALSCGHSRSTMPTSGDTAFIITLLLLWLNCVMQPIVVWKSSVFLKRLNSTVYTIKQSGV